MKYKFRSIAILVGASLALWGCQKVEKTDVHEHVEAEADRDHEGEEHEGEGHEHEPGEIVLEPEVAERLGVTVQAVTQSNGFRQTVQTSGIIEAATSEQGIATAPIPGIVTLSKGIQQGATVSAGTVVARINGTSVAGGNPNDLAKVTLEATKREYERLKGLQTEGLITMRELVEAQRAYEEAKAAYIPKAASGTAVAPVSGIITGLNVAEGQFVEVGAPIITITSTSHMTLTAYLPQSDLSMLPMIEDARISIPGTDRTTTISALGGRRLSATPSAASGGFVPVTFTFTGNPSSLPIGATVDVWLLGAHRRDVISVPRTAISEQQGAYYVYVREDEHGYVKHAVTLGESDGEQVEITHGLEPGEEIVVTGVSALRLAETSGTAPEGHSHHH